MNPTELILLIAAAVLVVIALALGKKAGADTRSARLMKKYKTITPEQLDAIPDGELVDAVVCRILARTDEHRPDPTVTLASLERGSTVVYSVWVVCKEMASGDFHTLMTTASAAMVEPAIGNLRLLGADRCADALEQLWQTRNDGTDQTDAETAFRQAVQTEQPLGLCEEYIRTNPEEFTDAVSADGE